MKINLQLMNKKGQAAAELAILGVLIITAFSYIMNFGQSLGAQQQVKMESFRRALQKAYVRNSGVSYTLKKNVSAASMNAGFFQGQGLSPEASSSVTWQKGKAGSWQSTDESSFAFWLINNKDTENLIGGSAEYELPLHMQYIYGNDGSRSDDEVGVPAAVYKDNFHRTEGYGFSGNKQEGNTGIAYNKAASLNDSIAGTIYTHFNTAVDEDPGDDDPEDPVYENAAATGYSNSISYVYPSSAGSWTVPHD